MKNTLILTKSEDLAYQVAKQAVFVNYNYKQTVLDIKDELNCSLLEAKSSLDGLISKGYIALSLSNKVIFGF